MLSACNHPADVDVVAEEDFLGFLDGRAGQASCSSQDPGKVDMEEPQNIRAGVDQGHVRVVGGQDPVRGVGQDFGVREHNTRSKPDPMQCFHLI